MTTRTRRIAWAASVLVTAALGAIVFRTARRLRPENDIDALVAAVGSNLPFNARLSAGFPPSTRDMKRSAAPSTIDLSPDARIAIAQIEKRAASDRSPKALDQLGVAYLVAGDPDKAVTVLEEATSIEDDGAQWSDLSAAYLVKAERMPSRRIEYIARSLEASTRSLRRHPSNEAAFNHALAMEALAPYVGSSSVWTDYLSRERDRRWIAVAREHTQDPRAEIDPRAAWDRVHKQLRESTDKTATVDQITDDYPEACIEFVERELLPEWGRAVLSHRNDSATILKQVGLVAASIARTTGDPLLERAVAIVQSLPVPDEAARAHIAYAEGMRQYDENDYESSRVSFEIALRSFGRIGSPYSAWTSVQISTILFQRRELDEAESRLAAVERSARRDGFRTLLARTLWLRGLTESKRWKLDDALNALRESAALFEGAREFENLANIDSVIGANLRMLGEYTDSWQYSGRMLNGLSHVRKPIQRYLFLFNASLFASSQDLLEAALQFQDAALRESQAAGDAAVVEALTQRATIFIRQGREVDATRDLEAARRKLLALPVVSMRRYLQAEIDVLLADVAQSQRRRPPIDDLRSAIDFFSTAEPAIVPRLWLGLARSYISSREERLGERALEEGISILERQQETVTDGALRISYFDESRTLFSDMIELQSGQRRDPEKAFEFAERSRARTLLSGRPVLLHDFERRVPESIAVVYYATLVNRILIWVVTRDESHFLEVSISRDRLARLVTRYLSEIVAERDSSATASELHSVLVAPIAAVVEPHAVLVFMPEGELQRVPFATLRPNRSSRYLIEDHPVLVAPSATFFLAALARVPRQAEVAPLSGLLVGDPGATSSSIQPHLPGAEAEAKLSAAFYARHQVLTGSSATKTRFLETAPQFDVVHFGGHALANAEYPQLSRLLFAAQRDGDPEPLYAYEVARLHWPRTRLVVLAACGTASGAVSQGEGVISVARPFLAAGVPTVIASEWDIEDRAAERLFVEFHREFARSRDAAGSLQHAQIALLRSGNPELAAPARWGAFIALGAGIH